MLAVRYKVRECPCCGGEGHVKTVSVPHSHGWVGCPECGLYIQWDRDPHGAIAKWNRRKITTDQLYDLLHEEGGVDV